MSDVGKMLMVFGALLLVIGIIISLGGKIPWVGKLPGDIYIEKKGVALYFPLATSIVVSVLLSILFMLMRRR